MFESFTVKGLYIAAALILVPFLIVKMVLIYLLELHRDFSRRPPPYSDD